MVENPKTTLRSRHLNISYHYIRELVAKGAIKLKYIPSNLQLAYGYTKILGNEAFETHKIRHKLVSTGDKDKVIRKELPN